MALYLHFNLSEEELVSLKKKVKIALYLHFNLSEEELLRLSKEDCEDGSL